MPGQIQHPELHDIEWLEKHYVSRQKSCREIADELGCGDSTVSRALRKYDIDRRSMGGEPEYPRIHDPDFLRKKCYRERMTTKEIAKEVGCSSDAVGKMARKFGIRTNQKLPIEMRLPENTTRDEVIKSYTETGSLAKAGERFGVSPATIASWLDQLGVERTRGAMKGSEHPQWNPDSVKYYGENWWSQRKRALSENGYKCRACGVSDREHRELHGFGLDVHHISPIAQFDDLEKANELDNLAVLCRKCHAKYEGLPILPERV